MVSKSRTASSALDRDWTRATNTSRSERAPITARRLKAQFGIVERRASSY